MRKLRPGSFWAFILFFSAFAAPICNSMLSLRMSLLHAGALTIFFVIALAGGIFAITFVRLPRPVQAVMIAVPSLVFIDVAYGGNSLAVHWDTSFQWMGIPSDSGHYLVIVATATVISVIAYLLAANAPLVFGAIFSAILLSTLIFQETATMDLPYIELESVVAEAENERAKGKPVIVILLFDELMSASAFPDGIVPDAADAVKQRVFDFHEIYGFRIYPNAYSRHYWTRQSIPAMLNIDFERTTLSASYLKRTKTKKDVFGRAMRNQVVGNAIFEKYVENGYVIEMFQADIMFYCGIPGVIYCATLDSFNQFSKYLPVERGAQPLLTLTTVLNATKNSYFVKNLQRNIVPLLELPKLTLRIDVHVFLRWFAKIKGRILEAQPGTIIFAHILVPHAPYMLNDDCSLNPGAVNPYALAERIEDSVEVERTYVDSYQRYYGQLNCLYSELETLFKAVESNPILKDATFVITGDHGSRISKTKYAEDMDARDLIDNFATHFSIRAPGLDPGIDLRMAPVQRLLGEHLTPSLVTEPPVKEHTVMANIKDKPDLVKVDMVDFGSDVY